MDNLETNYAVVDVDDFQVLCERAAVAEERLTALWNYIESEDKASAKRKGKRMICYDAEHIKVITGYREMLAAYNEIQQIIEDYEKAERQREEQKDGDTSTDE